MEISFDNDKSYEPLIGKGKYEKHGNTLFTTEPNSNAELEYNEGINEGYPYIKNGAGYFRKLTESFSSTGLQKDPEKVVQSNAEKLNSGSLKVEDKFIGKWIEVLLDERGKLPDVTIPPILRISKKDALYLVEFSLDNGKTYAPLFDVGLYERHGNVLSHRQIPDQTLKYKEDKAGGYLDSGDPYKIYRKLN